MLLPRRVQQGRKVEKHQQKLAGMILILFKKLIFQLKKF